MRLIIHSNHEKASCWAAGYIADKINLSGQTKPFVLGLPTGSSPLLIYRKFIKMHREGRLSFKNVRTFNMDEYIGLSAEHAQSYRYFMRQLLFDAVGLPSSRAHIPNGEAKDPIAECAAYDKKLNVDIDMQILGIGTNGHIGFNEPAENLIATTVYVPLTEETIESNARHFASPEEVPRHAFTMGMHSILMARRIILLANGENKANILRQALCGPITTYVPGSLLQLHRDVTIVADRAAASLL